MKRIPLRGRDGSVRAYALVDDVDYERVGAHRWSLHSEGYAYRNVTVDGCRRSVLLHREIMGLEYGDARQVDHEHRERLDCRRSQLRVVTHAQNAQNVPARGVSRFRGVSPTRAGRWRAYAAVGGRHRSFGTYPTEFDAAVAAEAGRRALLPFALPDPELVRALERVA